MNFSDGAALLIVVLAGLTCWLIINFTLNIKNLSPSSNFSTRRRKPAGNLNKDEVDIDLAKQLLAQLGEWVQSENPDYILGTHFSGLMISSKIAKDIGYDIKKVAYSENLKDRSGPPQIYCCDDMLKGKVCIVDDISRRGVTLSKVADSIFSDFHKGRNRVRQTCYGVMMLVEASSKSESGFFLPDKVFSSTFEENIIFPWSQLVDRIRQAHRQHEDEAHVEEFEAFEDYQHMIANPEFAAFCLELSLTDTETYRDCLGKGKSFLNIYLQRYPEND